MTGLDQLGLAFLEGRLEQAFAPLMAPEQVNNKAHPVQQAAPIAGRAARKCVHTGFVRSHQLPAA